MRLTLALDDADVKAQSSGGRWFSSLRAHKYVLMHEREAGPERRENRPEEMYFWSFISAA